MITFKSLTVSTYAYRPPVYSPFWSSGIWLRSSTAIFLHPLDDESNVMWAFAVPVERFSPGARVVVRLDQFQVKRTHVEECQLRPGVGALPSVLRLRLVNLVGDRPLGRLNTKELRISLRRRLDVVDENANLRNQFGA